MSVHDNRVLSILVDCTEKRITFRTVYELAQPPHEFTNIVFDEVAAYHWEGDNMGTILFDVEEILFEQLFPHWDWLFEKRKNYRWMPFRYEDENDLRAQLSQRGLKAFIISPTDGMSGFVLAKRMIVEPA